MEVCASVIRRGSRGARSYLQKVFEIDREILKIGNKSLKLTMNLVQGSIIARKSSLTNCY
jgi:hypothetical protein